MQLKKRNLLILSLNLILLCNILQADDYENVFSGIYQTAHWGKNEAGEGTSGEGSTVENTVPYRVFLQQFLKKHKIKTVIDIGCGDWQFSKLIDWDEIDYLGIDVVNSVIEKNIIHYADCKKKFIQGNFLFLDLPQADLVICKDVLQHLPNDSIKFFIPQLTKFKHCLITNDVDPIYLTSTNHDIPAGAYRLLDLTKPPFNLKGEKVLNYSGGTTIKQVLHIKNEN